MGAKRGSVKGVIERIMCGVQNCSKTKHRGGKRWQHCLKVFYTERDCWSLAAGESMKIDHRSGKLGLNGQHSEVLPVGWDQ